MKKCIFFTAVFLFIGLSSCKNEVPVAPVAPAAPAAPPKKPAVPNPKPLPEKKIQNP